MFGFGLFNRTIDDGVDNGAGILDGDALAGTIPAGIDQIGFGSVLFHFLNQRAGVHRGVQGQKSFAESGGERRNRFGDATFRSGQLGGEAAQEVVLSLVVIKDGNRRQYTKRIG
ncbi:MAG: hypothetical protein BWY72_02176 [Bacteroidetes bacterium ADurb.Bin416]|nr:MAG: hypothetical protein BWY72_02176 [Bacteroidetes bacterium ADurb.Bin416]